MILTFTYSCKKNYLKKYNLFEKYRSIVLGNTNVYSSYKV